MEAARSSETSKQTYYPTHRNNLTDYPFLADFVSLLTFKNRTSYI
jgi:hypothetical protein